MAPAKRKTNGNDGAATTTVTRRSTRLANKENTKEVVVEEAVVPKKKKARVSSKAGAEKVKSEDKGETKEEVAAAEPLKDEAGNGSKTIVIEHCKQCNSFKVRADKVRLALETGVSGITILVNPEKPRRGCFEVREEGGEKFISLLDMKRPFTKMKDLDMDAVISDIINKIK